jgi:MFS family permease
MLKESLVRPAYEHVCWNFTVLGLDMALFSLGLNISSSYTVLPLFVHHLTASNTLVSLIPAVRAVGFFVPPLLIAGFVERLRYAKPLILGMTVFERLPYLWLGLLTPLLAALAPGWLLAVFFGSILVQTGAGGLTLPPWLDMVARVIPEDWRGRFFGGSTGLGGALGIGGAAGAAAILRYIAWPWNFSLCFLLTFGMMAISFCCLALAREPERVRRPRPMAARWRALGAILRNDRDFRRLILANALSAAPSMASGLFAVAAAERAHLPDATVGALTAVFLTANTVSNFIWGPLGDHYGHRVMLALGMICGTAACAFASMASDAMLFGLVFLCFGLSLAASQLAQFTFVIEFGPESLRPTYIALSYITYAPFAIGAPLTGGFLADHVGFAWVFALAASLAMLAALLYFLWVPDPRMRARRATGEP